MKTSFSKISDLVSFIRSNASSIQQDTTSAGGLGVNLPYDIKAKEFLHFAELDLQAGSKHGFANAVGNIKRSIECQIDTLLYTLGFGDLSKNASWTFPRKLSTLKTLQIVAPRILEKINRRRNSLEHQYQLPPTGDIEDSLDVATLFLAYVANFIDRTPNTFSISVGELIVEFTIDSKKQQIRVDYRPNSKFITKSSESEYPELLAFVLSLHANYF